MSQKISFYYEDPRAIQYTTSPKPASHYMPDWFKASTDVVDKNHPIALSAKKCMGMVDAYTFGYIFELACDLHVKAIEEKFAFSWDYPFSPITDRDGNQIRHFPRTEGFSSLWFAWVMPFGIKTPKGWSVLITHPQNHFELPFITMSGVMDTDGFGSPGAYPFSLPLGFSGTIKKGTPLFQVIPFKRDQWNSEVHSDELANRVGENKKARLQKEGYYRDNFWDSKVFR